MATPSRHLVDRSVEDLSKIQMADEPSVGSCIGFTKVSPSKDGWKMVEMGHSNHGECALHDEMLYDYDGKAL
jgi:hypothetical protein